MRRREFVALLCGAPAVSLVFQPLAARGQQTDGIRRIGVLVSPAETDPEGQARIAAFRKRLQELGWTEGRNIQVEYRWTGGSADRLRRYAAELVRLKPDVILAGATTALAALQKATQTIPIVFAQVTDPVGAGFVKSLAQPGGNITGFTQHDFTIAVKWLELLKQIAPRVSRVAILYDPTNPATSGYLRAIEPAAPNFGVQVSPAAARDKSEVAAALQAFAEQPNGGLIVLPGPVGQVNRELVIALTARYGLPAVYPFRYHVDGGGLASYGVDNIDLYRRAAEYVDRILKGERPADLPVQNATKFELVINLRTAKALGLDVSPSLLAGADEVIE